MRLREHRTARFSSRSSDTIALLTYYAEHVAACCGIEERER